ncbi:MAG: hypothetical protein AVDCRST_MAG01-01-2547, partial [uncultured Rubrobacteraceae bacterium]
GRCFRANPIGAADGTYHPDGLSCGSLRRTSLLSRFAEVRRRPLLQGWV